MDRHYLFSPEGKEFKANLHCHSTLSDGALTPEQVKDAYKQAGYSVVAFTDHRTYNWHKELDDGDFLTIAAFEADINEERADSDWNHAKTWHLNFYDCDPQSGQEWKADMPLPESRYHDIDYINGYVEQMNQKGFLACYNHPYWSLQDCTDYNRLRGFWAMEIYNHGCEVDGLYGYHPQSYDEMLRSGQKLCCVATDDNHNSYPLDSADCDSFGGYIVIRAAQFSYSCIMDALKEGSFYFSMGPQIQEAWIEGSHVHVKTSPVEKIYLTQSGRNSQRVLARPGEMITEADFELKGDEKYFRIDIRDEKGMHAGTNAWYLK